MCGGRRVIAARSAGRRVAGAHEHADLRERRVERRGSPRAAPGGSSGRRSRAPQRRDVEDLRLVGEARRPARTRESIAERNAASVLPEPVGAAMSVCRPSRIGGQPSRCGGVGSPSRSLNQVWTAGWKGARSDIETGSYPRVAAILFPGPEKPSGSGQRRGKRRAEEIGWSTVSSFADPPHKRVMTRFGSTLLPLEDPLRLFYVLTLHRAPYGPCTDAPPSTGTPIL